MKRWLLPSLNPTGLGASVAAIYAVVVMLWNASHHHGVIDPEVIVAALGAAAFLYSRMKVTPVADPKDGNGSPLLSVAAATAIAAEVMHATEAAKVPSVPPTGTVTVLPPVPGLPEAKL